MHGREIETLEALEATYWWHLGRRRVIEKLIERFVAGPRPLAILDLGCGTGRNLRLLERFGNAVGVDSSPRALAAARRQGNADRVAGADALRLPFLDRSFDLVSALDVFEHLEDDVAGFGEVRRVLKPGGHLLAAVPAFRFLWSEHDEVLGHRRRYVASEMHQKLNLAGFQVIKRTYAISFAFPLILAYRIWRGLFPKVDGPSTSYVMLPAWLNGLFAWLLAVEASIMGVMNLPIGTSVFVVGRRVER